MLKKTLLSAVAIAVVALAPLASPTTHAAIRVNAVQGGVTFPTGTNGCTGPLVGVYGSSAIKGLILQSATDYCATFANKATAPDVEYAGGGDSCPGVDFAADNADANEIGVSDVFPGSCTGSQARSAAAVAENLTSVNIVLAIAQCSGANVVQGGAYEPGNGTTVTNNQCTGTGSDTGTPPTFIYPNDLSVQQAVALFGNVVTDLGTIGGQSGGAPTLQQRATGSGTRITYCDNVFGPGRDTQCVNNGNRPAPTTGEEEYDVCGGDPYTSTPGFTGAGAPTSPVADAIGYASRAGILADSRPGAPKYTPLSGCGLITLNGSNAWNATCDPTNPGANGAPSFSGDGVLECNGDNQVVSGRYTAWGYEHLYTNANGANNAAARAFINYINTTPSEQTLLQKQGFMRNCQMAFARTVDAGPYSPANASC